MEDNVSVVVQGSSSAVWKPKDPQPADYEGTPFYSGMICETLGWPCEVVSPASQYVPTNVVAAKPKGQRILVKFFGERDSYSWPNTANLRPLTRSRIHEKLATIQLPAKRKLGWEIALDLAPECYLHITSQVMQKPEKKRRHGRSRSASVKPRKSVSVAPEARSRWPFSVAPTSSRRILDGDDESAIQTSPPARLEFDSFPMQTSTPNSSSSSQRYKLRPHPSNKHSKRTRSSGICNGLALPMHPEKKSLHLTLKPIKSIDSHEADLTYETAISTEEEGYLSNCIARDSTASSVSSFACDSVPSLLSLHLPVKTLPIKDQEDQAIANIQQVLDRHGQLWGSTATHLYQLGFKDASWLHYLNKVEMGDFLARNRTNPLSFLARARLTDLYDDLVKQPTIVSTYQRVPFSEPVTEEIATALNSLLDGLGDIAAEGLIELGFEEVEYLKLLEARQGQHEFFQQSAALSPLAVYLLATRALELSIVC